MPGEECSKALPLACAAFMCMYYTVCVVSGSKGVHRLREQPLIACICVRTTPHMLQSHNISVQRNPQATGTAADCAHMGAHRITYPARVHCKANVKQH